MNDKSYATSKIGEPMTGETAGVVVKVIQIYLMLVTSFTQGMANLY